MAKVVLYTTQWCGYCAAARELLRSRGIEFEDIDVDSDRGRRQEMIEKSGNRTVPQIFINDESIGGFTDLAALDEQEQLDKLLNQDEGI
jgi:glutaredoxin 3